MRELILSTILVGTTLAQVPRLVSAWPAPGDEVAVTAAAALRVEFDQDMVRGSHSFVGGGPSFPTLTGPVVWRDARTCGFPMRLEAGRVYQIGLNGPGFTGFRTPANVPLAPVSLCFMAYDPERLLPEDERAARNAAALSRLMDVLRRYYAHRDRRVSDWDAHFERERARILSARTDEGFAVRTALALAPAEDLHLGVRCGPAWLPTHQRSVDSGFRRPNVERAVRLEAVGPRAALGITEDRLGYLLIETWERGLDLAPLHAALERCRDLDGLVIDVRPNGGGDERLALEIAGWFVEGAPVYATHRFVRPTESGLDFGPWEERRIQGHPAPRKYRGPLAVLVGPAVVSSCEAFVWMLDQAPTVRTFGQTTGGSSGNPQPRDLGNGVVLHVPSWQAADPLRRPLEGHGIVPDEPVTEAPTPECPDPTLARAFAWLRARPR